MTTRHASNNHLIDSHRVLTMLQAIAQHRAVNHGDLQEVLNVSRATITRLISSTRTQLGVDIRFGWRRGATKWDQGEYWIADWGVFSRKRVLEYGTDK